MKKHLSDTEVDFAANWVGDGFRLAARRLREIEDDNPEEFSAVAKLLKIGYRRASDLAQVDRAFRDLKVDRNTLTTIGWTKLQLLSRKINKLNCGQLLEMAAGANVRDLKRILKYEFPIPKARCVVLYFSNAEYALFAKVILAHGAKKYARGIVDKEVALSKALSKLLGKA